jgi:1-acyl-sn-glycerol-3-phosphate acyltransferase
MASRAAFLPPKVNPLVLGLARRLLPTMFRRYAGGLEVRISEADLGRRRTHKRQRLLLLPNHPTHYDPMVMMEVSSRLEEDFLFVAAREVFDRDRGFHGWLLQRCGVYSLIRGAVDRESFALTQKILQEGKNWLVIFIEGEVSMENDTVIPFEAGVLSLALRSQHALAEGTSAGGETPPIHVGPVAMKTRYKPGVEGAITRAIAVLEERVGLGAADRRAAERFESWEQLRSRIDRIGGAVLQAVEQAYLMTPAKGATVDERIDALRSRMLSKMESFLEIPTPPAGPRAPTLLDRVRTIRNKMDRIVHAYGEVAEAASAYERRQLELRRQAFVDFYADLGRLVNFLTLRGDYLATATPERFAEVVLRLEQEILGKPRLVYPRTVDVQVGELVNLRDHLPAYARDKKKTAAELAERLEMEMTTLLRGAAASPVVPAGMVTAPV